MAFVLSTNVTTLIGIRFIQGIASAMIMPVVQAYVGDITPLGREGWIMGLFNMSMFIGLSAGPLIGGVIKDRFSLKGAFLCMGALSLMGFLLSLIYLPPTAEESVVKQKRPPGKLENHSGRPGDHRPPAFTGCPIRPASALSGGFCRFLRTLNFPCPPQEPASW